MIHEHNEWATVDKSNMSQSKISRERAVLAEIDKDLLTGLVSIPASNTLHRF